MTLWAPRASALLLALCAAVVAAGCGLAPARASVTGPTSADLVKFAACMRSHGLPSFPDPTPATQAPSGSGPHAVLGFGTEQFVLNNTDPRSTQFQSAMKSCHQLVGLPASPGGMVLTAKQKAAWVKVAACMRASGFPTFPDPKFGARQPSPPSPGQGGGMEMVINGAMFDLGQGINAQSSQFQSAFGSCQQKYGTPGGIVRHAQ